MVVTSRLLKPVRDGEATVICVLHEHKCHHRNVCVLSHGYKFSDQEGLESEDLWKPQTLSWFELSVGYSTVETSPAIPVRSCLDLLFSSLSSLFSFLLLLHTAMSPSQVTPDNIPDLSKIRMVASDLDGTLVVGQYNA